MSTAQTRESDLSRPEKPKGGTRFQVPPFLVGYLPIALSIVSPNQAGESDTTIPAERIASILSPAPPLPPAMMAPA